MYVVVVCRQCKPEQVQAVQGAASEPTSPTKRDRLQYELGDVVTVLDKRYAAHSGSGYRF